MPKSKSFLAGITKAYITNLQKLCQLFFFARKGSFTLQKLKNSSTVNTGRCTPDILWVCHGRMMHAGADVLQG